MLAEQSELRITENIVVRILGLGILWGLMELFLGSWIKSWQPALFGILMPGVVVFLMLYARTIVPLPGSLILMGIVAGTMKLFLAGMVFHGAFMAILIEAVLVELLFGIMGLNLITFILSAITVQFYSLFHPLLSKGVFCQSTHFVFFKRWLEQVLYGGMQDSLSDSRVGVILLALHFLMGLFVGLMSWKLLKLFSSKLRTF